MNYFRYCKEKQSPVTIRKIYDLMWGGKLKNYAKVIYKAKWEDALDLAFQIVVQNFDPKKGNLENYATKTIRTCMMQYHRREVPYEFMENMPSKEVISKMGTSKKPVKKIEKKPPKVLFKREEILSNMKVEGDVNEGCLEEVVPLFIKDYKTFVNSKILDIDEYRDILSRYSPRDLINALIYLRDEYSDVVGAFYDVKKSCSKRKYNPDRQNNIAPHIQYIRVLNNTILYRKLKNSTEKYFYSVSIDETVKMFLAKFYNKSMPSYLTLFGTTVYCTLTGNILYSLDELCESLKSDIVGILTSRLNIRILYRDEERVFFLSNNELEMNLGVSFFGVSANIEIRNTPSKEV